jgi:hypothetical protein
LRKIVLLRWGVGAGSVPGVTVGGARFGVLRLGEGRVPSRDYVGKREVPVAGKRDVEVSRRVVGRRGAGRREAGRRRAERRRAGRGRRVGQQQPPWPVAGDGPPRYEVCGEVVAFQRFLERSAEINLWATNRSWSRHPTGE